MNMKLIIMKREVIINKYSPSNVATGFQQNYFYKVEWDGKLDVLLNVFKKNGNNWIMNKEEFEQIITKKRKKLNNYSYKDLYGFSDVCKYVLEEVGN